MRSSPRSLRLARAGSFVAVARSAFALAFALTLSTSTRAHAGETDDTVMLKNGGRVRGIVVEEDPAKGVRIKLPGGELRAIPAKDVDRVVYGAAPSPAPPPPPAPAPVPTMSPSPVAMGALQIVSTEPARASLDGGEVGPTPTLVNATAGGHRVEVVFDDGGTAQRFVYVRGGATETVTLAPSGAHRAWHAHAGPHFGFDAGFSFDFDGKPHTYGGGTVGFVYNQGLTQAMELRVGVAAVIADGKAFVIGAEVPVWLRFHLGATYLMGVGVHAGLLSVGGNAGGAFGPSASVLGFRFGPSRDWEIRIDDAVSFGSVFKDNTFVENTLVLTHLFL
jgi:hypothetical protein